VTKLKKNSLFISMIAIFASLNVVLDSFVGVPQLVDGVWYSWIFVIEPLNGIVLGPYAGFLSTVIGVMIGHFIYFRGIQEFLFTIGAPVGAMVSGLLFKGRWKTVFVYYMVLFAAYFLTPIAWQLPVWGMWNTYCACAVLCITALMTTKKKMENRDTRKLSYTLPISAFIGLEADILFRIFLFIPCRTYQSIYGFNVETVQLIWVAGAVITPIQVVISVLATLTLGIPLIKALKKTKFFNPGQ
jgi:hypothetical protein